MDRYSGTRVKIDDINEVRVKKDNVTTDFILLLQNIGRRCEPSDAYYNAIEAELKRKAAPHKTPLKNWIIGGVILLVVILLPLILTAIKGHIEVGVIWAVVVAIAVAGFVRLGSHQQKLSSEKLESLHSRRYEVYSLEITEKMWCVEQSTDDYGTSLESFFVRCGDVTLRVPKQVYESINNEMIVVLFSTSRRSLIDYLFPLT